MEPDLMLAKQIVALAWIRCLQEEGVNFVNKTTGKIESDEAVVYQAFEAQDGSFDVPKAKASIQGMEKNLLEVYGNYCLRTSDPYMISLLFSDALRGELSSQIENLRKGSRNK